MKYDGKEFWDETDFWWELEWTIDEEEEDCYGMYDDGTDLTAWRNGY